MLFHSCKFIKQTIFLVFLMVFLGGVTILQVIPVKAQDDDDLTRKLLDYVPPSKPTPKPWSSNASEIRESDLLLYQKIFVLQNQSKWAQADDLIKNLHDKQLLGYVLRDRYLHPTGYSSNLNELVNWMNNYADYAGADRIYKLAMKKVSQEKEVDISVKEPISSEAAHRYIDITKRSKDFYTDEMSRSAAQEHAFLQLSVKIRDKIRNERPTEAYSFLNQNRNLLTELDYNRLKARVSGSYMHEGKLESALKLSSEAARLMGTKTPYAAWIAGLTSWRLGRYKDAAYFFELTAGSEYANAWTRAGGAFWASRAHMRAGNFSSVSLWLNRAASEPRTFYGLIATRALSKPVKFDWSLPVPNAKQIALVNEIPAGARAIALAKLNRYEDAEQEFEFVEKYSDINTRKTIIALANQMKMPSVAWRGASYLILEEHEDVPLAAQYPVMRWAGGGDYKVSDSLLHAIIRQESRFNPHAQSPSGAMGLMQLLPSTGRGIMGSVIFDAAGGDEALLRPEFNIQAGQKYVHELFNRYSPNKNLFDMLIAWNAGPGNLKRWKKSLKNIDDPLLFIETIPVAETRAFVERIMANYWMYQNRFGLPTSSLDAVTEGKWPIYFYQ